MQDGKLSITVEPPQSTRQLKIEADGDFWKGAVKPKIRLKGQWLERAGFNPGDHVSVKFLSPGIIELRSVTVASVSSDETPRLSKGGS